MLQSKWQTVEFPIKGTITMQQNQDKYNTMIFGILTLITALRHT